MPRHQLIHATNLLFSVLSLFASALQESPPENKGKSGSLIISGGLDGVFD
jgi:hypothetical protein